MKLTTGLNGKNPSPQKEEQSPQVNKNTSRKVKKDRCHFMPCDYVLLSFLIISGLFLIAGVTLRLLPYWGNHRFSEEAVCRVVDIVEHGYTDCNECYDECGTPWYEEQDDDDDDYKDDDDKSDNDDDKSEDDDEDYKKPEMMSRKKRGFGKGKGGRGGCKKSSFPCMEILVEKIYKEYESSEERSSQSSEPNARHLQGQYGHHGGKPEYGDRSDSHEGRPNGGMHHRPPRPEGDMPHHRPKPESDEGMDENDESDEDMDENDVGAELEELKEDIKFATLYHNRFHMQTLEQCSFNACGDDQLENAETVREWASVYSTYQQTQELFECYHEEGNHEQVIAYKGRPKYLVKKGIMIPAMAAAICLTILVLRRFCCNKALAKAKAQASAPPASSVYQIENAVSENDNDLPKKQGAPDISRDMDTFMTQLPIKQDSFDLPPAYKPSASRTTSLADMTNVNEGMEPLPSTPPTVHTLPQVKKQEGMPDIM